MAPARIIESEHPWTSPARTLEKYGTFQRPDTLSCARSDRNPDGPPRNIAYIEALNFDPKLQPKNYEIAGTHPDSKILFLDVNILECTGQLPYKGDVLIEGLL